MPNYGRLLSRWQQFDIKVGEILNSQIQMMIKHPYETLKLSEPAEHVLKIVLNRPESANAFNTRMAIELYSLFESLSLDLETYRCLILTGSGERAFCAGGDLKERNGMTETAWTAQHRHYERMARALLACPVPVVAAVNGSAFGGGCELVAACDFAYAATRAKFALPETSLGIIPGAGGTQTLSRAVGERRAKELILTARVFAADEAAAWGLVNQVVVDEDLASTVLDVAKKIAGNAPIAVRQAKSAIHRGLQMSLTDGLAFEIEAYNLTVPTTDRLEGVSAFNEKRKPVFTGR